MCASRIAWRKLWFELYRLLWRDVKSPHNTLTCDSPSRKSLDITANTRTCTTVQDKLWCCVAIRPTYWNNSAIRERIQFDLISEGKSHVQKTNLPVMFCYGLFFEGKKFNRFIEKSSEISFLHFPLWIEELYFKIRLSVELFWYFNFYEYSGNLSKFLQILKERHTKYFL